jgi:intracellular sulfur oxidation DsrE/DsrF family protein
MLDTGFYDTLSRLRLRMSHRSSLNVSGSRKSVRKGNSTEFSDFREYMPGDDLRRLDWNAYARLDKLYIREYMEEKEAAVSVLIDTSASMDYGVKSKADLAVDLTAAVSFLALNNTDRVLLYDMKEMGRPLAVGGGRKAFAKVLHWLENREFSGEVDMVSAARKMRCPGAGVTVVISDFLHPDMLEERAENPGYEKLLQYLNYCKQLPVILHTMAAEELHVTLEGALNLIDAETKEKLRLVVDARALDNYERELKRFTERLKKGCACGRGVYVLCDAGKDRRQLVFQDLRVIYDI